MTDGADVQTQAVDGSWVPAIPEPFWVRRWFRWRPACYEHKQEFRTREQHDEHWFAQHIHGIDWRLR